MVIVLKNRAAIYQREAAEMLHNISLYPGLTEEQLCRFFPEKEATAKALLAHMLKEGRIFCSGNNRYYANAEIDNITRFERGSALIVTNSNNVTVDMRCSEEEKDLITTDRDELRRIVERKMQNQPETEES